jgi:hypothetical protein
MRSSCDGRLAYRSASMWSRKARDRCPPRRSSVLSSRPAPRPPPLSETPSAPRRELGSIRGPQVQAAQEVMQLSVGQPAQVRLQRGACVNGAQMQQRQLAQCAGEVLEGQHLQLLEPARVLHRTRRPHAGSAGVTEYDDASSRRGSHLWASLFAFVCMCGCMVAYRRWRCWCEGSAPRRACQRP